MEKIIDVYESTFSGTEIDKGFSDHHYFEFKRNDTFGLCLFLDGILQSTERDQATYHAGMTRFALSYNQVPRNVLIIGGAGGGILHQLLKTAGSSVEHVMVVDVDQKLFELAPRYMGAWSRDEQKDPRVETIYENGVDFLRNTEHKFDTIFLDVGDPLGFTKSVEVYQKSVYFQIQNALVNEGIMAFHTAAVHTRDNMFVKCYEERRVTDFNARHEHAVLIKSFEFEWMFNVIQKRSPLDL